MELKCSMAVVFGLVQIGLFIFNVKTKALCMCPYEPCASANDFSLIFDICIFSPLQKAIAP